MLEKVRNVRLLVVGDVMLDRYWFGEVSRISPEAPVPVVKVEHIEERPGGAANVALNSAALGAHGGMLASLYTRPVMIGRSGSPLIKSTTTSSPTRKVLPFGSV